MASGTSDAGQFDSASTVSSPVPVLDEDGEIEERIADESNWEGCSLCSSDGGAESDEKLPIPGRESHTCDMDAYFLCLARLRAKPRNSSDTPFHEQFWDFFRNILEKARPVGYDEVPSGEVLPKGPKDNEAFINKVSDTNLINPIHPILLSQASGVPLKETMTELLYASKTGMMRMKLTPNCLRCNSSVCAVDSFHHLPVGPIYCEGCRYENSIECLEKIKVIFVLSMDVLYVLAESFACQPSEASMAANQLFAMVPATFSGSGFRYSVGCGGEYALRPPLAKGTYRMHCPVARTDNYLVVERDATEGDTALSFPLHVSDVVRRSPFDKHKTLRLQHGKFHLDIFTNTNSFFVCWIQNDLDDHTLLYLPEEERKPYTNAQELLGHPTYQHLFATETEANLTNVLKRMSLKASHTYKKSRTAGRPMRSMMA